MEKIIDFTQQDLSVSSFDNYLQIEITKGDSAEPRLNIWNELSEETRKLGHSQALVISQLGPIRIQSAFRHLRNVNGTDGLQIKRLAWVEKHPSSSIAVDLICVMIRRIAMNNVRFFKEKAPAVEWLLQDVEAASSFSIPEK